jgi:hypothetical protein
MTPLKFKVVLDKGYTSVSGQVKSIKIHMMLQLQILHGFMRRKRKRLLF